MSSTVETTMTIRTLTAATAQDLIDAAAVKADEIGVPMAIAISDASGGLVGFRRMDRAPILAVGIAQDKAFTAASFGIATDQWFDFIKEDPPLLAGIVHTPRLVVFGGGQPVKLGDELIGAIGVAGGHYSQDMVCAAYALEACGFSPVSST